MVPYIASFILSLGERKSQPASVVKLRPSAVVSRPPVTHGFLLSARKRYPLNATDMPNDLDGDGICDAIDPDMDGDGLLNDVETDTGFYNNTADTGTDPANADTDGDGVCDGPEVPANGGCSAGPDAFPHDAAASLDTDGDGMPDGLNGNSTSTPPLVEDEDDDNDTWPDEMEALCGTSSVNAMDRPADTDGDGTCDTLDEVMDLAFNLSYPTQYLDLFVNQTMDPLMPNCLLYTSPSPRDVEESRMPSSA